MEAPYPAADPAEVDFFEVLVDLEGARIKTWMPRRLSGTTPSSYGVARGVPTIRRVPVTPPAHFELDRCAAQSRRRAGRPNRAPRSASPRMSARSRCARVVRGGR